MTGISIDKATNIKRKEYYHMLRKLKDDYLRETLTTTNELGEFANYVENRIGLRMQFSGGMITEEYIVVDQEKYFLYKLKQ